MNTVEDNDKSIGHKPKNTENEMTPSEMLHELIRLGYIAPSLNNHYQPIMPSAFREVSTITTSDSWPINS